MNTLPQIIGAMKNAYQLSAKKAEREWPT